MPIAAEYPKFQAALVSFDLDIVQDDYAGREA
jgi:hypothetical protein